MFKCQYSGELSDPVKYDFIHTGENVNVFDKSKDTGSVIRIVVKPAEKPVRVIVRQRKKFYENMNDNRVNTSEGLEIEKELLIRAKYLDEVKQVYKLS